jgi:hypothetical protein
MPTDIHYSIRNQTDDSIITWATSQREADRVAKEVQNGEFDSNARECWIAVEDPDWNAQGA